MFIKSLLIAVALMSGLQSTSKDACCHSDVACHKNQMVVYVTRTGKKFHRADCYHIDGRITFSMSRSAAIDRGYQPCKNCRP